MRAFLILILLYHPFLAFAQLNVSGMSSASDSENKEVDDECIRNWTYFNDNQALISADGSYYCYGRFNRHETAGILFVASTDSSWKVEMPKAVPYYFSKNSKYLVVGQNDSLKLVLLGTKTVIYLDKFSQVRSPKGAGRYLLFYTLKSDPSILRVLNLINGKKNSFSNIVEFVFDEVSANLYCTARERDGNANVETLTRYNLVNNISYEIIRTDSAIIQNVVLGATSSDLCVILKRRGHENKIDLLYTDFRRNYAFVIPSIESKLSSHYPIKNIDISIPGRGLVFISAALNYGNIVRDEKIGLTIWHYRDRYIQYGRTPSDYVHLRVDCRGRQEKDIKFDFVTDKFESLKRISPNGQTAIVKFDSIGSMFWKRSSIFYTLVKFESAEKIPLPKDCNYFEYSPDGNYIFYYDVTSRSFSSINIRNNIVNTNCGKPPHGIFSYRSLFAIDSFDYKQPIDIAFWKNNHQVYVYDQYDIWLIDITNGRIAINCTNGFGRKNNITLRFMKSDNGRIVGKIGDELYYLAGFNNSNKYNGFYLSTLAGGKDPKDLSMGPYIYYLDRGHLPENDLLHDRPFLPLESESGGKWLIKKSSYSNVPNYYITSDFLKFDQLTSLHSPKKYNWPVPELLRYKIDSTHYSNGIMYKPLNFDSTKKYPVIFYIYQQTSQRMFDYASPNYFGSGHISIPWFVSRGYLVFTPDIHFRHGENLQSALNCVLAGRKYISMFSYIDSNKLGICGHSVSGGYVNYIISQTNLFCAAFSGAGASNLVSSALDFHDVGYGGDRMSATEGNSGRSIWDDKDYYWRNSAVRNADDICTPLLIFHCKDDGAVPWHQAVELYLSLRRLEKKVWLIEYKDGRHSVGNKRAEDLTRRVTQFFDYFLKGKGVPLWMTNQFYGGTGGGEIGFKYDAEGVIP